MNPSRPALALVLAVGVSVVACRAKTTETPPAEDDETAMAEDGTDTHTVESDAEALTSTLVAGSSGGTIGLASADLSGSDLTGETVGDGTKAIYFPKGCLDVIATSTAAGEGTATYTFKGCTGPNGLLDVRGDVHVTYKASATSLTLDIVGDNLLVNKATVDWTAHAEIDANGAARTMKWKATLSGTTARGRDFDRQNDEVVTWTVGEPCLGVSGTSEGDIHGRDLRTEITSFRRCRGSCPDAGGKIVVTNVRTDARLEIDFDGTNRATIIGPKGNESTLPLLCR